MTQNEYYKKQAKIHHEKYIAAANIGEDDEAKKHKREYDNYIGMIKDD